MQKCLSVSLSRTDALTGSLGSLCHGESEAPAAAAAAVHDAADALMLLICRRSPAQMHWRRHSIRFF